MSKISVEGSFHITIPNHDHLKLGTLSSILSDIAEQLKLNKEDLINKL